MSQIDFEKLSDWAWGIRELTSSIEAIFINEDLILAGDKEGYVGCWNHDGELLWKQEIGSRVENFTLTQKSNSANLFLVAGLEICGLNSSSGEIIWRAELEGISDWVIVDEKHNQVIATSSVFDIEHYDFMEGACWRFTFDGELLDKHNMDEKAWHLYSNNDQVILGLGRPRNGMLTLEKDNYEHINVNESPICCGYKNIFGHANGTISIFEKGEINSKKICNSSISNIMLQKELLYISNQSGQLYCKNKDEAIWEHYCSDELCLLSSVQSPKEDLIFASTRTDNGSKLFLLNSNNGDVVFSSETNNPIRTSSARKNMLILGMNDGKIIILEMDLLLRRLNQKESDNSTSKRNEMLEKLRKLRK